MTAVVYHVCGMSKLKRYQQIGFIKSPVRAWIDILEAERFSKQTGRPIILRLRFKGELKRLEGHKGKAVYQSSNYILPKELSKWTPPHPINEKN